MKIIFDHQTFSNQDYGGISRYFYELIAGINQHTDHQAFLSLYWSNNAYLKEHHFPAHPFFPKIRFPRKNYLLAAANKAYCMMDIPHRQFDIFHSTYYDPYFFPLIGRKPVVVTFLDMIHEKLSSQFRELAADQVIYRRKKMMIERATHLIAISQSTKDDMVDIFGADPNKIRVIHLASSLPTHRAIEMRPTIGPESTDYVLFVGNRGHYKNFIFFAEAVAPVLTRYNLHLLCAGGGAFTTEEQMLLQKLAISDQTYQVPINDSILRRIYQHARVFVFPSLYEGFGIPVLEAFSCGCPCIVSRNSSLPEVAGEAALYIDPSDRESIAHAVEQVVTDEPLRQRLITDGTERLTQFSWTNTVQETLQLYHSLL